MNFQVEYCAGDTAVVPPKSSPDTSAETTGGFEALVAPEQRDESVEGLSPQARGACLALLIPGQSSETPRRILELARDLGWNNSIELDHFLNELEAETGPNAELEAFTRRIRNRLFDTKKIPKKHRKNLFSLSGKNVNELFCLGVFTEQDLEDLKIFAQQAKLDTRFLERQSKGRDELKDGNFENFTTKLSSGTFDKEIIVGLAALEDLYPWLKPQAEVVGQALVECVIDLITKAASHHDIGITVKPKTGVSTLCTVLDAIFFKRKTLHLSSFNKIEKKLVPLGIKYEDAVRACVDILRLIRLRLMD